MFVIFEIRIPLFHAEAHAKSTFSSILCLRSFFIMFIFFFKIIFKPSVALDVTVFSILDYSRFFKSDFPRTSHAYMGSRFMGSRISSLI